jgi:SAM-dependent methyltransferase
MKPFAQSCETSQRPILEALGKELADARHVLEIGCGTGQHAVYFAASLPHLVWSASDLPRTHAGIRAWFEEADLPNLRGPIALDVEETDWPIREADAIFTANTLHAMPWRSVGCLIRGAARTLVPGGMLVVYGPFRFGGDYASDSAIELDSLLRMRNPSSGLRDFEAVDRLAAHQGLRFRRNHPMPEYHRLLVWQRP